jgi:hypothetical protein
MPPARPAASGRQGPPAGASPADGAGRRVDRGGHAADSAGRLGTWVRGHTTQVAAPLLHESHHHGAVAPALRVGRGGAAPQLPSGRHLGCRPGGTAAHRRHDPLFKGSKKALLFAPDVPSCLHSAHTRSTVTRVANAAPGRQARRTRAYAEQSGARQLCSEHTTRRSGPSASAPRPVEYRWR